MAQAESSEPVARERSRIRVALTLIAAALTAVAGALIPTADAFAATEGDFAYADNGDGTATITNYTGSGGDLTIPDTVGGLTVTVIGQQAFEQQNLEAVVIPDAVVAIEDMAF